MIIETPSTDVAAPAAGGSLLAAGISGGIPTVTIGPNGNRSKLAYPNGTETNYTYDDLNRLTNLTTTGPLGTIQSYAFALGPAGNRERIDEHDGSVRAYTYDDLYRLTNEEVSDNVSLVYSKAFSYDPVGNRLSQTTVGTGPPDSPTAPGMIDYTYDDRDRILTEGAQPYSWNENGNLVTKDAEASYFWDFENRLVQVEKVDGTVVTHAYDADGNRVRTEITPANGPPEVTEFLVDPSDSLSHVAAESDGAGALIAHYVRGDDLLAVIRPAQTRYFHADGLGSIRRLTDESGNITDGYTYAAFGELLAHTGSDAQPYAFTGEPLGPHTRFQYHRARWLDPRVGRFANMDPFRGFLDEPSSLHKYLYGGVNPANAVDPSGELSLVNASLTVGIIVGLAAATFTAVCGGAYDSIRDKDGGKPARYGGTHLRAGCRDHEYYGHARHIGHHYGALVSE